MSKTTTTPEKSSDMARRLADAAGQVRRHIEADPRLPPAYIASARARLDVLQTEARRMLVECRAYEAAAVAAELR
ncbi:hypothetical protein [Sphaerotilus mobilis]|uniref:Uncharacterized protein n=1 Tax=Sphaerotilus mobilis TaxID=47994 RepID=A0A4Q7LPP8_9BURK|nr:hypothetical protein [Sphaerotilus mobilis]RZS56715.1 hypothetical protein EV685_1269 [Sphaerotilus mobilis]